MLPKRNTPASDFARVLRESAPYLGMGTALAATVGLYFAFLAVMAVAFADPRLIVPMGIFYIYIIMAFGVPALWVRMKPDHTDRPLSWSQFMREGIATHTGRMAGKDAAVQVLILPTLIFGWGVAMAVIVALIS